MLADFKCTLYGSCLRGLAFESVLEVDDLHDTFHLYNAIKDDDPKCWSACYRIRRRGNGRTSGRGGGRTGGRSGDQGNGRIDGQGEQGRGQGNGRNQNGDAINDNIQGDLRNVIENNDHMGCTYKEFLACNPKEYDGKEGAVVYTCWIEKIESV
ncbi:hypothetical protein Tco_0272976 [Tanacetum coccineum]